MPECCQCHTPLTGRNSPKRICRACRNKQFVGLYKTIPDWDKLIRCIQPAADIYEPGHEYALNLVEQDIQAGIVSWDCFANGR